MLGLSKAGCGRGINTAQQDGVKLLSATSLLHQKAGLTARLQPVSTCNNADSNSAAHAAERQRMICSKLQAVYAELNVDAAIPGGPAQQAANKVLSGAILPCASNNFEPLSLLLQAVASTQVGALEAKLAAAAIVQIARQNTPGAAAAVLQGLLAQLPDSPRTVLAAITAAAFSTQAGAAAVQAGPATTVLSTAAALAGPSCEHVPARLRLQLQLEFGKLLTVLFCGLQNGSLEARMLAADILLRLSEKPQTCSAASDPRFFLDKLLTALAAEQQRSKACVSTPVAICLENAVYNVVNCSVACLTPGSCTSALSSPRTKQGVSRLHVLNIQPLVHLLLRGSEGAAAALFSLVKLPEVRIQLQKHVADLLSISQRSVSGSIRNYAFAIVFWTAVGSPTCVQQAIFQQLPIILRIFEQYASEGFALNSEEYHMDLTVVLACQILHAPLDCEQGQAQIAESNIVSTLVKVLARAAQPPVTLAVASSSCIGTLNTRSSASNQEIIAQLTNRGYAVTPLTAAVALLKQLALVSSEAYTPRRGGSHGMYDLLALLKQVTLPPAKQAADAEVHAAEADSGRAGDPVSHAVAQEADEDQKQQLQEPMGSSATEQTKVPQKDCLNQELPEQKQSAKQNITVDAPELVEAIWSLLRSLAVEGSPGATCQMRRSCSVFAYPECTDMLFQQLLLQLQSLPQFPTDSTVPAAADAAHYRVWHYLAFPKLRLAAPGRLGADADAASSKASPAIEAATAVLRALIQYSEYVSGSSSRKDLMPDLLQQANAMQLILQALFSSDAAASRHMCEAVHALTSASLASRAAVSKQMEQCLGQLCKYMQLCFTTAAALVKQLAKQPQIRQRLLQHLPSLLNVLGRVEQADAAMIAAELVQSLLVSEPFERTYDELDPLTLLYSGKKGGETLALQDITPLVKALPHWSVQNSQYVNLCTLALSNLSLLPEGCAALKPHIGNILAGAEHIALLEMPRGQESVQLAMKVVARLAASGAECATAVLDSIDMLFKALYSSNRDLQDGALDVLANLTASDCCIREDAFAQVSQQEVIARLINLMQAANTSAGTLLYRMAHDAQSKPQLLPHVNTLLDVINAYDKDADMSPATTAAEVLFSLTCKTNGVNNIADYSGVAGRLKLAQHDLSPLVRGMLASGEDLQLFSYSCCGALYNVRLVDKGRVNVAQHVAELLQAAESSQQDKLADLALRAAEYIGSNDGNTGIQAILKDKANIERLLQILKQRKRPHTMLSATCDLLRVLVRSTVAKEMLLQKERLDVMFPELVYQVQQQQKAAAKCVEAVAQSTDLGRLAVTPFLSDLIAATRASSQLQSAAAVQTNNLVTAIVMDTMKVVCSSPNGVTAVTKQLGGILAALSRHLPPDDAIAMAAANGRHDAASAACELLQNLAEQESAVITLTQEENVVRLLNTLLLIITKASSPASSAAELVVKMAQTKSGAKALAENCYMEDVLDVMAHALEPNADAAAAATARKVAKHMSAAVHAIMLTAAQQDEVPTCVGLLCSALQKDNGLAEPLVRSLGVLATYHNGQLQLAAHKGTLERYVNAAKAKPVGEGQATVSSDVVQIIRDMLDVVATSVSELHDKHAQSCLDIEQKAAELARAHAAYRGCRDRRAVKDAGSQLVNRAMLLQKTWYQHEQLEKQVKATASK